MKETEPLKGATWNERPLSVSCCEQIDNTAPHRKVGSFSRRKSQLKLATFMVAVSAFTVAFGVKASAEPARSADQLVETIGIGSRFDWIYGDGKLGSAQAALSGLHIRYLRVGALPEGSDPVAYTNAVQQMVSIVNARICLNFGWDSPGAMEDAFNRWNSGDYGNLVYAVEGVNESWGKPSWSDPAWSNALDVQKYIYGLASPKGMDVYNFTMGGPANAFYCCVDQPAASQTDAYITHGNFHPYHWYTSPNGRGVTKMNGLWQDAESPNHVGWIQALYDMLGDNTKPFVATEYGWDNSDVGGDQYSVSESARAKLLPRAILENFNSGMTRGFIYSLFDSNDHYGVANESDGSLRKSGQAIADLISIVQEPGKAGVTTGTLNYKLSVDSGMSTVDDHEVRDTEIHHTLLEKSNGAFYLVLWVDGDSQNGAVDSQAGTVTLDSGASAVNVYRPTTNGTAIVASLGSVSPGGAIRLQDATAIPDDPLIIEIEPNSSGGGGNGGGGGGAIGNGTYKVLSQASGKALDVSDISTADGALIHQWTYVGGANQQWQVAQQADGSYTLTAQHSGKLLDVPGSSTDDSVQLIQWPANGGANQHFRIESVGGGYYQIVNVNSGKCVDVQQSGTADGVPIQQYSCNGSTAQAWSFATP